MRFAGTRCQLGSISLTLSRRYSRQWLLHDFVLTPQPVHLPSHVAHKPLATISSLFFSRLHVAFAEALCYTRALCKYCSLPTRFYTSAAFVFGQLLSTYMALTLLRFDAAPH